ncbi:hypothetical protein [Demequina subtropica]|uniref:hypothetical protein n=1 Tax=Demequina subtropica TaxID=1638989 RepID=UPI000783AFFE|nr:hypothetical protein [Demequina subtropica]
MAEPRSDGINRRRVLQGAAWAAPAIVIATSAPAWASASPPDPPDITVDVNPGGNNVADIDVGISLPATIPPGYTIDSPFTVTISLPRDDATLTDVILTPSDSSFWVVDPTPPANGVDGVSVTYVGPPISSDNPLSVSINAVFNNGIDSNSTDPLDHTVSWNFSGSVNDNPVSIGGSVTLTN